MPLRLLIPRITSQYNFLTRILFGRVPHHVLVIVGDSLWVYFVCDKLGACTRPMWPCDALGDLGDTSTWRFLPRDDLQICSYLI